MTKSVIGMLVVALGVLVALPATPQDPKRPPPKEQDVNYWMKRKLEFSQNILSGLATADFDAIGKNAQSMGRLSKVEKWVRRTDAEAYRTQLRVFLEANQDLVRQADRKNIDGATLAFTRITLSCVDCHKVLRDQKK